MADRENGRKDISNAGHRAWSIMDTLILILCVATVASLVGRIVYAYRRQQTGGNDSQTMYSVRFTVEGIHRESLKNVCAFDTVYLYETGERLGNIGVYENEDGTQHVAFVPRTGETATETETVVWPVKTDGSGMETTADLTERTAAEGLMFCSGGELENGCLYLKETGMYIAPGTELTVCTERVLFRLCVKEILPQK